MNTNELIEIINNHLSNTFYDNNSITKDIFDDIKMLEETHLQQQSKQLNKTKKQIKPIKFPKFYTWGKSNN